MSAMVDEQWAFEGGDPDVGIFGSSVVHCCVSNDDCEEADEIDRHLKDADSNKVIETTTFKCSLCGATTSVTETYPKEWFE